MSEGKISFTVEEGRRKEYIDALTRISSPAFNLARWEELRRFTYRTTPLDLDVVVDDTTLREGLQMAGLGSPTPSDMCQTALLLREIGVDREEVITYAKSDQEGIKLMRDRGLGDMLAAWCRAANEDVDIALKLDFRSVGVSHPVSYIHFRKWPDSTLEQLASRVVSTVEYAADHGLEVFVHGEDSTRADWSFEKKLINLVAEAGAKVYRVCDTVGCGSSDAEAPLPYGIPAKIRRIWKETKIPYAEIHAHDDLGNAVENTMAAIRAASGLYDRFYASTTFLGIGDRAGNAETEKIMINCYMHHNVTKWNLRPLRKTANFIASSLNYHLPTNKALVGDAAFAHESGIHTHGVSILPLTYEVVPPELVGHERAIVVGKRSGRHGIQMRVEELLGAKLSEKDPRLAKLNEILRDEYFNGERDYPVKEQEFKELIRRAGFRLAQNQA